MSGTASGTTRQEQERSRVTRQKLMTAAIEVLVEKGWAGATMGAIAERAGVSRGACQHHFPTRAALVAAAVEHVFRQQVEELVRRAKGLPESRRRVEPLLNLLHDVYAGPLFTAATHLWVAAVADEELKAILLPLETHVGREVHRLTVELLGLDERDRDVRDAVRATLDLLRGLALANLLHDDTARRRKVLAHWARTLEAQLAPKRATQAD
ncbi:TetR/AcrR family transcriptional regulator [Corallococcus sp. AB011P]|uniref:TetR/AcrR family transcriptional regulator n=1 Tax=unclassified Corallococcus TaxID=2685029 RepID=UPI000EA38135|nr:MULTISPECIES: TetR/AcrR family transcriptional regulator [unclassified Corallococcus]RKG52594.1 TetR/AcrR family transcriptional regulator [Corallococcus sp. AB011P]RKH91225.1 TetR/AcrR family transcriptional regulator [Corallococcus sp. AB045]